MSIGERDRILRSKSDVDMASDAMTQQIIDLWNKGLSAAKIGVVLGKTKNAVHGKVARMRAKGLPLIEHDRNQRNTRGLKKPARPSRDTHSPALAEAASESVSQSFLSRENGVRGQGIKLLDLQPHHCRWPIGDPLDKEFVFCGNQKAPLLPYCPSCASVAYPLISPAQLEALYVETEALIAKRRRRQPA